MTNQEILTKAIEKAIENGWLPFKGFVYESVSFGENKRSAYVTVFSKKGPSALFDSKEELIFDHSFTKALWPRCEHVNDDTGCGLCWKGGWKYHLQGMVIAEDPIKYLGENLPEGDR